MVNDDGAQRIPLGVLLKNVSLYGVVGDPGGAGMKVVVAQPFSYVPNLVVQQADSSGLRAMLEGMGLEVPSLPYVTWVPGDEVEAKTLVLQANSTVLLQG